MSRFRRFRLLCCAASAILVLAASGRAENGPLKIGGTGSGLALMRTVADELAVIEPGFTADVLPSLGSSGGLRALAENAIDVAVAARPLKAEEEAKGLQEASCLMTALILATSHRSPPALSRAQLPALYADDKPTWPDGTPLKVILRSREGSEHPALAKVVPGLMPALEIAQKRPGIAVGVTDQENVELAMRIKGSLAITTLLQVRSEDLPLRPVAIDGVVPAAETIANGAYPIPLRLCVVLSGNPRPAATRLVAFIRSAAGASLMRERGAEPLP
jgi:phosphate transport system substrate-binding protein